MGIDKEPIFNFFEKINISQLAHIIHNVYYKEIFLRTT